ncbi:hypothetical protein U1Q18_020428 [Sarracenia purpurea var. burkii]
MLNQWSNRSEPPPPSSPAPSPDYARSFWSSFHAVAVSDHATALNFAANIVSGFDDGIRLHSALPAPWLTVRTLVAFRGTLRDFNMLKVLFYGRFIFAVMGYTLLTTVLILLEAALVGFIALDHHWEKDLPFDPTGELYSIRDFIEDNVDICKLVGILVLTIQALSLLIAMILRSMVSAQRGDQDIEGGYDVVRGKTWEPLHNPLLSQTSGSIKGDGKGVHYDIWSSRMREKYGLHSGDDKHNLPSQSTPINEKSTR